MENISTYTAALIKGIENRAEAFQKLNPGKKLPNDYQTIRNSIGVFALDTLEKGLAQLCFYNHITPEELCDIVTAQPTKTSGIPQKAIDKLIRLAQYIGGADWETVTKPGRRKWITDSFVSTLVKFVIPRFMDGQKVQCGAVMVQGGALVSTDQIRESISYYMAPPERRKEEIEAGSNYFNPTTAGTQSGQLRSLMIALGLATTYKCERDALFSIEARFCRFMVEFQKSHPVPRIACLNSNGQIESLEF